MPFSSFKYGSFPNLEKGARYLTGAAAWSPFFTSMEWSMSSDFSPPGSVTALRPKKYSVKSRYLTSFLELDKKSSI